MIKFKDLTSEEQMEVLIKAEAFHRDHKKYVMKIIVKNSAGVAPSGSDLFQPDLWKSFHWAWFLNNDFLDDVKEE